MILILNSDKAHQYKLEKPIPLKIPIEATFSDFYVHCTAVVKMLLHKSKQRNIVSHILVKVDVNIPEERFIFNMKQKCITDYPSTT